MDAAQFPPDFFSDSSIGTSTLVADVVTRLIGFSAIALRFISRRIAGAKFWWDDYLILASIIIGIIGLGVEIRVVQLGVGKHLGWVIKNQPQTLPEMAKWLYADEWLYAPIVGLIKLSMLALYIRIFGINKKLRYICYLQIVLVCIWGIVTEFLFIFQCTPIWVAWSPTREGGTCMPYAGLFIGTNTVNVIMDFLILITPLHSIWSLRLPATKKVLVTGVLALGAATLALSILRLVKLGVLLYVDATFDYGSALLYSVLESNIGTVCVCLPVMGPLLGKIFPSLRMHTSNNGASKHTSKIYKNQSRIIRKDGENSSGFDEERELVSSSTNRGNIYEPTAKS